VSDLLLGVAIGAFLGADATDILLAIACLVMGVAGIMLAIENHRISTALRDHMAGK